MAEYRALRAEAHAARDLQDSPSSRSRSRCSRCALGVDAAILFADILLPLEPMGAPFEFAKGEGPVIHEPCATARGIERLRVFEPEEGLGYVLEAIRLIRARARRQDAAHRLRRRAVHARELPRRGRQVSRLPPDEAADVQRARGAGTLLMSKLAEVVRRYLRAQVEAGAQAVQLFDSWVGALSPDDYREYVQPHVRAHPRGPRDDRRAGDPLRHRHRRRCSSCSATRAAP